MDWNKTEAKAQFGTVSAAAGHGHAPAAAAAVSQDHAAAVSCNTQTRLNFEDPHRRFPVIRSLRDTLFGSVSLARDVCNGNTLVALKTSAKSLAASGSSRHGGAPVLEDPRAEVQFLRHLNQGGGHPNVLRVIDELETETHYVTALEFCARGEFFDVVVAKGRLGEAEARGWFAQVLSGLAHIHARGIAHLDLSLENLLLNGAGDTLKICDFGVARHLPANGNRFAAEAQSKPGKIGYMSPEIFASQPFDGRAADLYSAGVILFIMLTGVPPYGLPSRADARFSLLIDGKARDLLGAWNMNDLISDAGVALIQGMICPEARRLRMDQLIAHPWFRP